MNGGEVYGKVYILTARVMDHFFYVNVNSIEGMYVIIHYKHNNNYRLVILIESHRDAILDEYLN